MSGGSSVAVALYAATLSAFGVGYVAVFFTAGKITSGRHTKSFYLVATATLTWLLVAQPVFDFMDTVDISGLLHLSQGLSYFVAFVLAFRLTSKCGGSKIWLLLLVPIAFAAAAVGLPMLTYIGDDFYDSPGGCAFFVAHALICHLSLIVGTVVMLIRYKPDVLPNKLANGSPFLDQEIGKLMAIPFVLSNAMGIAQDGFQTYLSANRSLFLSHTAYYAFSTTGWLEWLFFLAAFPGSYVAVILRNRWGSRRKGDKAPLFD